MAPAMIHALIVEDDAALGRAFGRLLSRHLDVVDVVTDGATAMLRIEIDAVDVVVTDYHLGDDVITGVELAARIRERWPHVVVFLVSGQLDRAIRAEARAVGVHTCYAKPVIVERIVETIRTALSARAPHAPAASGMLSPCPGTSTTS